MLMKLKETVEGEEMITNSDTFFMIDVSITFFSMIQSQTLNSIQQE